MTVTCDITLNSNLKLKIKREKGNKIKSIICNSDIIYTRLMVCAILNLAYSKEHILSIRLIYNKYII